MLKILPITGNANSGKTTLLRDLIVYVNGLSSVLIDQRQGGTDPLDIRATFEVNGKRIVITTLGDNESEMLGNIKYAQQYHADIWITASRKPGLKHCHEKLVYQAIETFIQEDPTNRLIINGPQLKSFRKNKTTKSKTQHKKYLTELITLLTSLI